MSYYQATTFNPYSQYSMYPMYNWGYNQPVYIGSSNDIVLPLIQQQTQQPQVNTTKIDSVSFSANKQIQQQKKEGLSTGAKWAIGLATTAALGIVAHKFIPPMRMQNRVQRIFLENFSKEEAKAIQKKYSDILKIQDKDEFIDKLFKELKKDYKLDNIPIRLDKTFKSGTKSGDKTAAAHFLPTHEKGFLEIGIDRTHSNESLLKSLTHEFRHAKQDLYHYQTSLNKKELIKIYEERIKDTFSSKELTKINVSEEAENLVRECENFYKKIGINRIEKINPNWEWGRKSLESYKTYANRDGAYEMVFYETDAKVTGNLMMRFAKGTLF